MKRGFNGAVEVCYTDIDTKEESLAAKRTLCAFLEFFLCAECSFQLRLLRIEICV